MGSVSGTCGPVEASGRAQRGGGELPDVLKPPARGCHGNLASHSRGPHGRRGWLGGRGSGRGQTSCSTWEGERQLPAQTPAGPRAFSFLLSVIMIIMIILT